MQRSADNVSWSGLSLYDGKNERLMFGVPLIPRAVAVSLAFTIWVPIRGMTPAWSLWRARSM